MTTTIEAKTTTLDDIRQLVRQDFAEVNDLINQQLFSKVQLIEDIEHYLVDSGGKRLRPLLALLAARACGYHSGNDHVLLAVIVEFLHTATLLHDDVVDESNLRRGRKTANNIWGNKASILAGDFLFSRAFQLMVKFNNHRAMKLLADTTNVIAEGEVMQLINAKQIINEDDYQQVIHAKTAKLFSATTELAALIAGKDAATQAQLAEFGRHLGIAFQIVDDVLDYRSDAKEMGKNPGDDLAEGKPTLPLIHAIAQAPPTQAEFIQQALLAGDVSALTTIQQIMQQTNSLDYCLSLAEQHCAAAKDSLSSVKDSDYKQALTSLLNLVLSRSS